MKNPILNLTQFEQAMKPIFETFGKAEYPPQRTKLIYDDVSDLTEFEFRSIVKHFCKTKSVKYPPLPGDFNTEAQGQRKLREHRAVERVLATEGQHQGGTLERILKQMGASNIWEASQKTINKESAQGGEI